MERDLRILAPIMATLGISLATVALAEPIEDGHKRQYQIAGHSENVVVSSSAVGEGNVIIVEHDNDLSSPFGIAALDAELRDGVIEMKVRSELSSGAPEGSRGFIGIAFRSSDQLQSYEVFYIRPTNGRAEDQIRRNHSTQYASHPDFPWYRLRSEAPGHYESYVDLRLGEWTELKLEIEGQRAALFVHGAQQPALIVNDLKLGADRTGWVALWVGSGTVGYFTDIRLTPTD